MRIGERELAERLCSRDDETVYGTLVECFEPVYEGGPFAYHWQPRASVVVAADPGQPVEGLRDRLLGLANTAQRAWRRHRFRRLRAEAPHLPVVVVEGDSWVAHPIIDDITDHLLDDERYPLLALGVGAAADVLGRMSAALEHEQAIADHGASALLLSGGGNDLMGVFSRFLHRYSPGRDPRRLLTDAVDTEVERLMGTLCGMLVRLEDRVPVVVHGYDYLRVRRLGKGGLLGPFFDAAGIEDPGERTQVLWAIVDRYNDHLARATQRMRWVSYVDLRGSVVADGEWYDDIHPTDVGFGRLTARIADVLLERLPKVH
jgi:hypothetical protein